MGFKGLMHKGLALSGAFDKQCAILANKILDNEDSKEVLEVTYGGVELLINFSCLIAATGAQAELHLDGVEVEQNCEIKITHPAILKIGYLKQGFRLYIAISRELISPIAFGSKTSHHLVKQFGKSLKNSDIIKVGPEKKLVPSNQFVKFDHKNENDSSQTIELGLIVPKDMRQLVVQTNLFIRTFSVSERLTRQSIPLEGDEIKLKGANYNIISTPTLTGTVQLIHGKPYILGVDAQTIGGYAVLGNIQTADFSKLAQLSPFEKVKFKQTSIVQALANLKQMSNQYQILKYVPLSKKQKLQHQAKGYTVLIAEGVPELNTGYKSTSINNNIILSVLCEMRSSNNIGTTQKKLIIDGHAYYVEIFQISANTYKVTVNGKTFEILTKFERQQTDHLDVVTSQQESTTIISRKGDVLAVLPGRISEICVQKDQSITKGQNLYVIESMKMDNIVEAPVSGVVSEIYASVNDIVKKNQLIMVIN